MRADAAGRPHPGDRRTHTIYLVAGNLLTGLDYEKGKGSIIN